MSASLATCLVAAEVFAWGPRTQPPLAYVTVLDTVSEVTLISENGVVIKGTPVGSTTEVELQAINAGNNAAQFCHRAATLVMARPGRFRLRLARAQPTQSWCTLVAN